MVQKRKSKRKSSSKTRNKSKGFKVPTLPKLKTILRKVSKTTLIKVTCKLWLAAPMKLKVNVAAMLERAPKKSAKRKTKKSKTRKARRR